MNTNTTASDPDLSSTCKMTREPQLWMFPSNAHVVFPLSNSVLPVVDTQGGQGESTGTGSANTTDEDPPQLPSASTIHGNMFVVPRDFTFEIHAAVVTCGSDDGATAIAGAKTPTTREKAGKQQQRGSAKRQDTHDSPHTTVESEQGDRGSAMTAVVELKVTYPPESLPHDVPQSAGRWDLLCAVPLPPSHSNPATTHQSHVPVSQRVRCSFQTVFGCTVECRASLLILMGNGQLSPVSSSSSVNGSSSVHLYGTLVPQPPKHTTLRPILKHRWYVCKGADGLKKGGVYYCTAIEDVDQKEGAPGKVWVQGYGFAQASQFEPFLGDFTPARKEKVVRIRRHPSRFADVTGEVEYGTTRRAIGEVFDEIHRERYLVWEDMSYSRIKGSEGYFLVRKASEKLTVFEKPTYYTPAREGKGTRIRLNPSIQSAEIGLVEPNEVKRAVALHHTESGEAFVAWYGGGYSKQADTDPSKGVFLAQVPQVTSALVCPALFASPRPPSPEITVLNGFHRHNSDADGDQGDNNDVEGDENTTEHHAGGGRKRSRQFDGDGVSEEADAVLRPLHGRTDVSLDQHPRVRLDY